MKKLNYAICTMAIVGMIGASTMTVNAKEVTTLEAGYEMGYTEAIEGTVEAEEFAEKETAIEENDEAEFNSVGEETNSTFTGNYGSSDEDEWVDMEPEDCPEHIWEYSYDDSEDEIVYFRFCLNCGHTECLDECPEELEYTLSDDVESYEVDEMDGIDDETE